MVQVQQQDAFNAQASADADRLKDAARKAGVPLADVEVDEAKTLADANNVAILVKGVPSTQAGKFRAIVNDNSRVAGDSAEPDRLPADYEAHRMRWLLAADLAADRRTPSIRRSMRWV